MEGVYTAIITPFYKGKVDYDSFEKLIEKQIQAGVKGIVPCGTTGESSTLSFTEHNEVVDAACKIANKRIKVIAGTGSNSTEESIKMSKDAEASGADACLTVTPYYNKPSPQGIIEHYKEIASSIGIPIILYNIPGRSSLLIGQELLHQLSEIKGIVGVKDAVGDINFSSEFIHKKKKGFLCAFGK